MKNNIALFAAACTGFLAAAGPSAAATTDIYMKTDPAIDGEVTARGYEHQIQLLSFAQSVQATVTLATGGGQSAGRASCGPITLTKHVDTASPHLIDAVMTGVRYQSATIKFVDTTGQTTGQTGRGGARNDYTVTLNEVTFTGVQQSDASPAELVESVSMIAAGFTISYTPHSATGAAGTPVVVNVSCAANTAG